jgi:MerR family Zn(II)-responsive transcriptional regulator of zntA
MMGLTCVLHTGFTIQNMNTMHTFKVTELANAAGVTSDTVRHYTRLGLIKAAKDRQNGYRFFSGETLARLRFIKVAQGLGFTLKDIKVIFRDADKGDSPCPRVREVIAARIEESAAQIRELQALQKRMQHALIQWDRMQDGVPDGHSICRLIESQK